MINSMAQYDLTFNIRRFNLLHKESYSKLILNLLSSCICNMNIYEYCTSEQADDDIIIIAKCSNVDTLKKVKIFSIYTLSPKLFFSLPFSQGPRQ